MRTASAKLERERDTIWQSPEASERLAILDAILKGNPIPTAYRLAYVANFYIGPLVNLMASQFKMTRPEWIVLFCLSQQEGLNAQQISVVTGRPKTSVSLAVAQLTKKKLIVRRTDVQDARRQVLSLTPKGRSMYRAILKSFVDREAAMLSCLDINERATLASLLDKMVRRSVSWAKPY